MKTTSTLKTLMILGATTLTLGATAAQADYGRPDYQPFNPWLHGPAHQQAKYDNAMKAQLERFDERQERQMQRILSGMERGKLTMAESIGLLREHLAIQALERKFLADGRLGPREMRELEYRLDVASQNIRYEKHDLDQQGNRSGPERQADNGRRYR